MSDLRSTRRQARSGREAIGDRATFNVAEASCRVGQQTILSPLSLTFEAGQFYGLIGHNGSGKSTFLKLLARQQQMTGGEIWLDDIPLASWSARAFARAVAYLPQTTPDAAGLVVRELVSFGRYPWHGALGRVSVEDRRSIDEALELTGLLGMAERLVDTLSGGERQRVWIAMLVAQNARFLLLDEPTSALDLGQQIEVMTLLGRLARERRIGIVAVLHDINMAARHCDHLIALRDGAVQHAGKPDTIMLPAVLQSIFGIPMCVVIQPETGAHIALPV